MSTLKSTIDENEQSSENWKQVLTVSMIGSVGLVATVLGVSYSNLTVNNAPTNAMKLAQMSTSSGETVYFSTFSLDEKKDLFEGFKSDFGKDYTGSGDEEERFANFLAFLDQADEMNTLEKEAGGSAAHGINLFADFSVDEFKIRSLGYESSDGSSELLTMKSTTVEKYQGEETIVDWRGIYTTAVKNQGYCGSCWAFSTTEQLESDSIRQGLLTTNDDLAPQQLVSCEETSHGCDGGDPIIAYDYIKKVGGLQAEKKYPYSSEGGVTGECKLGNNPKYAITIDDYHVVGTEEDMIHYVKSTGPLSVCVSAEKWMTYNSGVLSYCGNHLPIDHCVQVVGINTEEKYWIVRNQWSSSWGEDGYIYIAEGQNTCQISSEATYVDPVKVKS